MRHIVKIFKRKQRPTGGYLMEHDLLSIVRPKTFKASLRNMNKITIIASISCNANLTLIFNSLSTSYIELKLQTILFYFEWNRLDYFVWFIYVPDFINKTDLYRNELIFFPFHGRFVFFIASKHHRRMIHHRIITSIANYLPMMFY